MKATKINKKSFQKKKMLTFIQKTLKSRYLLLFFDDFLICRKKIRSK